jgi:lipid II:glycine glycyltransferase (peptidoglycan interpeptide bridge formation enzyme)
METIEGFVDEVESVLRANGARTIEMLEPPTWFDPCTSDMVCNILDRRGYQRRAPELDFLMTVDTGSLWEKLKPSRRQRINRCKRDGVVARHVGPELCQQVYDVIVQNRNHKGFPVTMNGKEVQDMLTAFPDRLLFFGVFKQDAMIASSICIKVNSTVLYVFYWGDLPGYEKLSPVSLLAECIYDYAKACGFSLIDFGTSTKDGQPIYGLMNFKREIGCFPCLKPAYLKSID